AFPLLLEAVGRDDRHVGGRDELLFQRDDAVLKAREVRPLVHAVVDDPPSEPLPEAPRQRPPERDLQQADRVADPVFAGERLEALLELRKIVGPRAPAVHVERAAVSHAQLRDPLRLGEEAPRLAVPDYEIRRREEEDAVAVAPELRGDLLRPLEAEVPVDDRED